LLYFFIFVIGNFSDFNVSTYARHEFSVKLANLFIAWLCHCVNWTRLRWRDMVTTAGRCTARSH